MCHGVFPTTTIIVIEAIRHSREIGNRTEPKAEHMTAVRERLSGREELVEMGESRRGKMLLTLE